MKPRLHRNRVWAILSQVGTDGWFFRPKRVINYRNVIISSGKLVACDTKSSALGMHLIKI